MAEDEQDYREQEDEFFQQGYGTHRTRPKKAIKKPCNARLDELSRPRKWCVLALWQNHADKFEAERLESIKQRVQEDFCMSPEETKRYMELIKKKLYTKRRRLEKMKETKKEKQLAKAEAFCLFKKFLKKAMIFACTNVAPPIVSPVIRCMSDSILILLSEIHGVTAPKRCDKTNLGHFLIALADWASIFLAQIYYEVDLDENLEIEKMKEIERALAQEEQDDQGSKKNLDESQAESVMEETTLPATEGDTTEALDDIEE